MRNRYLKQITFIGILSVLMYSCDGGKNTSKSSERRDSLLSTYLALEDSIQKEWSIMIADDDDKHVLMKRLLLEVSYTNNYDKVRFRDLNDQVDQLKAMRYDQKSMSNSALIDSYDSATFDLSDQIFVFARNHPRYDDFPLMSELIDDINGKNNYILMHRIHYDNRVKELNSFKEKNQKKLMATDPEIETEHMPLFELPS
ncbi:MAG: hypothetical protein KAQ62_24840 [Cyclobacteriaceae bacterium]|nr:hypothetical protein [Cyclobacteriaceae bacterium]